MTITTTQATTKINEDHLNNTGYNQDLSRPSHQHRLQPRLIKTITTTQATTKISQDHQNYCIMVVAKINKKCHKHKGYNQDYHNHKG